MTHGCHDIRFRVYVHSVNMYIIQCASKQQKGEKVKLSTESGSDDSERKREGPNGRFGVWRDGKREGVGHHAFCCTWCSAMTAVELSR